MAKLCESHLRTFENYQHTFFIEITGLKEESNLQFLGEYLCYGKRADNNQPGVSGHTLDQTSDSSSIYHYFCNRAFAMTGVSGGMMYRCNNDVYLYIGFNNPLIWSSNAFLTLRKEKHTAKWAYEQLEHNRVEMIDTCCGWKAEAKFEMMQPPRLTVKFRKEYRKTHENMM